jgi:SAM-dependent methyltransferase
MDYVNDTRNGYGTIKAASYYRQISGLSWMHLMTWLETQCVRRALSRDVDAQRGPVLDIPCGTGLMAKVFRKLGCKVVGADISPDMMSFARDEYRDARPLGFIQGDLAQTPFAPEAFAGVVMLGLMHRVPGTVRRSFLRETNRIARDFLIVSYSVDSPVQRLKLRILRWLRPTHNSAQGASSWHEIESEIRETGFTIQRRLFPFPFASAEVILVLRKAKPAA